MGYETVEAAMERVKDDFGQKTVNIALDVTLKWVCAEKNFNPSC